MAVLWAGWDHYLLCPSPQGQLCHELGNGWQADCSAGHEEWPAQLEWRQWLRSHGWPGSCQWLFAQPVRHHTPVVLLYCMPASHAPLMPAWPPTGQNIKRVKISNITDDTKKCDQYPAPPLHETNQSAYQSVGQPMNQSFIQMSTHMSQWHSFKWGYTWVNGKVAQWWKSSQSQRWILTVCWSRGKQAHY